jgi:hypothetical protein
MFASQDLIPETTVINRKWVLQRGTGISSEEDL